MGGSHGCLGGSSWVGDGLERVKRMPEAVWFPAGLEAQLQDVHVALHSQEAIALQMGEHSNLHATS